MRLLIVEDNEELAELLAKGLQTAGYQADVLSTVEDAKAVLGTTSYAALILDQPQLFSARETEVLELLMRSKGRVVSKKQVEDHIFGHSGDVASNAIEVYVHRLLKQL